MDLQTNCGEEGVSVAANIAEGSGRGSQRELRRFCRIALGSLNELEYHILIARESEYVPPATYAYLAGKIAEIRRMLTRFVQSLTDLPTAGRRSNR